MTKLSRRDAGQVRLWIVSAVLFVSYLCVAIPLPVVPVFTTRQLGLSNSWAGLAVGVAFFSTLLTRGRAGALSDAAGSKSATRRGLLFYGAGAFISALAGVTTLPPLAAYFILVAGRLLVGWGESLVGVGIITWGIGLAGPAQAGKVLAIVGAAIYGALAVGGPLGLVLLNHVGFLGVMAVSVVLPCVGILAIAPLAEIAPAAAPPRRAALYPVLGRIWRHGLIVCLQGVGFAILGAFFSLLFLHREWAHAGFGITAFGAGFVLVRLCLGHLPDTRGALPVATVSLAVEAVGQLLLWGAGTPEVALVGALMTGIGCSLMFPAMGREVVHQVPADLRGTAMGGFSAFQDLAYGLSGPVAGVLADRAGYDSVFLLGATAAGVALAIAAGLWRAGAHPSGEVTMQVRPPLRARQRFPVACIRGKTGKGEGAMAMSENAADKAICHEIGAAVVTALATRRTLTVQTLIDLVEASRHAESGCGPERRRAMAVAVALLTIFV